MEVHNPVDYLHGTSMERSSSRREPSSYYSSRLSSIVDDTEIIVLHPLIIGKDIVVCMPEVNKVLRNVYQVLSQANYYLSKHGITSRRYTGAQLIRIKMLGILGHEAKVCSYILQRDAERIFDSFDVSGDSRKSTRIQWMEPVLLDEKPIPPQQTRHSSGSVKAELMAQEGPVKVHLFRLNDEVIVCAPEVQKVVQSNLHQGATVGYYFTKLGIVPYKFIHTSHLDKIKELGIVKKCAVHCTYILKEDALRVFEAYGMTQDQIENQVEFLDVMVLEEGHSNSSRSSWKQAGSKKNRNSPSLSSIGSTSMVPSSSPRSNGDGCLSPVGSHSSEYSMSGKHDLESEDYAVPSEKDMTVHTFIVEGNEVVCMPDIHKIVQNIHGNSIQVNYYFNKLKVQKRRFCFAHLRELKSRNILQNNATYCTYVPKYDAEKLFSIYCLVDDPKLKGIQWSEPINLDNKLSSLSSPTALSDLDNNNKHNTYNNGGVFDGPEGEEKIVELPIHTFLMENQAVVITVPDVHRIVDFLDEQSASLDYHFRKLGIAKSRFTYAQLHQLRRLNVIKRPTVCTYIAKHDVNRLLKMYETERNRHRMARVRFIGPVQLVRGTPPQQQVGNPKYIKAEKPTTPLLPTSPSFTPDYVGAGLSVTNNGSRDAVNGSIVSPTTTTHSNINGLLSSPPPHSSMYGQSLPHQPTKASSPRSSEGAVQHNNDQFAKPSPGSTRGGRRSTSPTASSGDTNNHSTSSSTTSHPSPSSKTQLTTSGPTLQTKATPSSEHEDVPHHHSAAITHIQNIHPSIDCPIVIPNGDYDPMKATTTNNHNNIDDEDDNNGGRSRAGKRANGNEIGSDNSNKRFKYGDSAYEELVRDNKRKEDELRILHDGYQREVKEEKSKREIVEKTMTKMKESHRKEMDDLREELRKLKEEKLDSKLKLLHNRSSEENLLTNGFHED